jgi:hypothetical protein
MVIQGRPRTGTIQVSIAEIVDRMTILRIKLSRSNLPKPAQLEAQLQTYVDELSRLGAINTSDLCCFLARVNGILWHLENEVRRCEAEHQFGERFICAARMIIRLNDRRARIKGQIDELCQSGFRETKSYT